MLSPVNFAQKSSNSKNLLKIAFAANLGSIFEWYDYVLYGTLAPIIAKHFFSALNEDYGFILALVTFAIGSIIRPLGALFFAPLGDRVGRKITFLITIILMGASTFFIGSVFCVLK